METPKFSLICSISRKADHVTPEWGDQMYLKKLTKKGEMRMRKKYNEEQRSFRKAQGGLAPSLHRDSVRHFLGLQYLAFFFFFTDDFKQLTFY